MHLGAPRPPPHLDRPGTELCTPVPPQEPLSILEPSIISNVSVRVVHPGDHFYECLEISEYYRHYT